MATEYIKKVTTSEGTFNLRDKNIDTLVDRTYEKMSTRLYAVELPNAEDTGEALRNTTYTTGQPNPHLPSVTVEGIIEVDLSHDDPEYRILGNTVTVSNGDFRSTEERLVVSSSDGHYYIQITRPSTSPFGTIAEGFIHVIDFSNTPGIDLNYYMVSDRYPDRWFAWYEGELNTLVFYAIQEGTVVDNPAHDGPYEFENHTDTDHPFTTDSKLSSVSLSVSGNYSNHTHTMSTTPTGMSGSYSVEDHTHTLGTSTTALSGAVAANYVESAESTGDAKSDSKVVSGNFKYAKATGASSATSTGVTAGAVTISGANFNYNKANSTTAGGGNYTVSGSNFKYVGNTISATGTTLVIGTETRNCSGDQIVNAHTHTVSFATVGMSNSQSIADHTHSVTNSSAKMTGSLTLANHTHSIGSTTTAATITHTLKQVTPALVAKASVTLNGDNFTYDKCASVDDSDKKSFTSTQTKDTTHNHTVKVTIGDHVHEVTIA